MSKGYYIIQFYNCKVYFFSTSKNRETTAQLVQRLHYRLGKWRTVVWFLTGSRDTAVLWSIQTGSGDHTHSYSMGHRHSFPECKTSGCEADNSLPFGTMVKNVWYYTSTTPQIFWHKQGHYMCHWWTTYKHKMIKGLETKWAMTLPNTAPRNYIRLQ